MKYTATLIQSITDSASSNVKPKFKFRRSTPELYSDFSAYEAFVLYYAKDNKD